MFCSIKESISGLTLLMICLKISSAVASKTAFWGCLRGLEIDRNILTYGKEEKCLEGAHTEGAHTRNLQIPGVGLYIRVCCPQ